VLVRPTGRVGGVQAVGELVGELKEQDAPADEVCEVIITAPDPDWLVESPAGW
jgi:hypothetical protein